MLLAWNMRQLPGKTAKESRKMKRERKKGNSEGHQRILTIALPVLVGLFALLVAYVYTAASKHWTNFSGIKDYEINERWMKPKLNCCINHLIRITVDGRKLNFFSNALLWMSHQYSKGSALSRLNYNLHRLVSNYFTVFHYETTWKTWNDQF